MAAMVGKRIAHIIAVEGHSSSKVTHLLSCLFAIMTKADAEKMILKEIDSMPSEEEKRMALKKFGKEISSRRWRNAGLHEKNYGVGLPNTDPHQVNHRRRLEERTMQDFIEWLNAKDYLQNLAFGEKPVRIKNGLYVAIESVKRTQSISAILREYYNDFGEEIGEDIDEGVATDYGKFDEAGYYSDEEDEETNDNEGGEYIMLSYLFIWYIFV